MGWDSWRMLPARLVNCYHSQQKKSSVWTVLCFHPSIPLQAIEGPALSLPPLTICTKNPTFPLECNLAK